MVGDYFNACSKASKLSTFVPQVLVVGDYFNAFAGTEIYRDTFDLIAAGAESS